MAFLDRPTPSSAPFDDALTHIGAISAESSVAEVLRRRILSGRLGAGDRLRQSDIARELGVSTTPVREALRSLTAEGLLEIDTNKGAVIRRLTPGEMVEVLELTILIESASLSRSIPAMTVESLERAEHLHGRMLATSDPAEWALLNRDFHLALAVPSGRMRTQRTLRELLNVSAVQLRDDIQNWKGRRAEGEADHARFIEIARARETADAVALISAHTQPTIDHIHQVNGTTGL